MYSVRELLPTTPLIVSARFGPSLSAPRVAGAIARGLEQGGVPAADLCPIAPENGPGEKLSALLDAVDFNARMLRARAVILAERLLQEHALTASATFEIATRARQAGVPAYAVAAENTLDPFDARILDLQAILEAGTARALTAAGRRLANLI